MKKIVVFSNDPIKAYYHKGEIKARYFNPGNFFNEVHIITPCNEDIIEEKVQEIAGEAKLKIYAVKAGFNQKRPWTFFPYREKVLNLVKNISPNVTRGFNLTYTGYLAVYCARRLGIPSVVSVHTDYTRWHNLRILGRKYLPNFIFSLIYYPLEKYIIENANLILGAYEYALEYLKNRRNRDIQVLYNKVYPDRYDCSQKSNNEKPVIISVGRHIKGKNPENLIKAVKDLDVTLMLIGRGEMTPGLRKLTADLKISDKVKFIESVPNSEIHKYYLKSDIYALSVQYPGLAIPVIEAMAASLPIVVSRPLWGKEDELLRDITVTVENKPDEFERAFKILISNPQMRRDLGEKARRRASEVDGQILERKEMQLYQRLIQEFSNKN